MGLLSLFQPTPPAPAAVPTDERIPLHMLDGHRVMQSILLEFAFRFDDVLDVDMLHAALTRLLEIDGWRKLGARVRVDGNGNLEYHLPDHFSAERPGVHFTRECHSSSLSAHPLGSQLPRSCCKPTIFSDPDDFTPLLHSSSRLTSFTELTTSDRPCLSVHVVSFSDATLLTVSFPHTLFDAVGFSIVMNAWLSVLNKQENQIPPFMGFHNDPLLIAANRTPATQYILYNNLLSRLGLLKVLASVVLEFLCFPRQETRTICLPGKYVAALHQQASDDLSDFDEKLGSPFLSEGDVLFAWWARITCHAQNLRQSRIVRLGNFFTFRGLLDDVFPKDKAFVGNAISICYAFMTVRELLQRPLGVIAWELRKALEKQRSRDQVQAVISLMKRMHDEKWMLVFAPWNAVRVTWSNWHRARFFEMDFSAAVLPSTQQPREADDRTVGRPTYINYTGRMTAVRNSGPLLGKDANGDWWLQWTLRKTAWAAVEQHLRQLTASVDNASV